jgi:hypothetical protein
MMIVGVHVNGHCGRVLSIVVRQLTAFCGQCTSYYYRRCIEFAFLFPLSSVVLISFVLLISLIKQLGRHVNSLSEAPSGQYPQREIKRLGAHIAYKMRFLHWELALLSLDCTTKYRVLEQRISLL